MKEPRTYIISELVKNILNRTKIGEPAGCSKVVTEMLRPGGGTAVKMLIKLANSVLRERRVPVIGL